MKDIYRNMNSQNILHFYGSKLDLKLDSSELYDYELDKNGEDYNTDVLDLTTDIVYSGLTIDTNLLNFSSNRDTITLYEYDNTNNDENYIFSGLTLTLDYNDFVSYIDTNFSNVILNNNIFNFTGITGEEHFFYITSFNDTIYIDPRLDPFFLSGFTNTIKTCSQILDGDNCCPLPNKLDNKPWAFDFSKGHGINNCDPTLKRRTENGWTLDFVFNQESHSWSAGGVFYYLGVRGEDNISNYADNNLSFQFTSDGRIKWVTTHYSGVCDTVTGYGETYYNLSGQTQPLCITDNTKDFNLTIVFDRNKHYTGCDVENDGGWNDLIIGPHAIEYTNELWAPTTGDTGSFFSGSFIGHSTQTAGGYTMITNTADWLTGATPVYQYVEELNKKWDSERQRRFGTLKIYLNGKPIYKLKDWEEVIPSSRGVQPFIQSWGGGTGLMGGIHEGVCSFNIKSIKYYEEPLDFVHVNHNFIRRLNQYDFFICGGVCEDNVTGFVPTPTPTPTPTIPHCPPSLTGECPTYLVRFSGGIDLYYKNTGTTITYLSNLGNYGVGQMAMDDSRIFIVDVASRYHQYNYTISPDGCFNMTLVNSWDVWSTTGATPNASQSIAIYDQDTLIIGESAGYEFQTGSTLYLYSLTTSTLTKWLEIGNNAAVGNIYYNTGSTQLVLSYYSPSGGTGNYQLYLGSTNPQLISQMPVTNISGGAMYFSGNTITAVNVAALQWELDFLNQTVTLIEDNNHIPIPYVIVGNYEDVYLETIVQPVSCYTFNLDSPNQIVINANFTPGSLIILYTATADNPVNSDTQITFDNIIELYDGTSILIRVSITILSGQTIGTYEKTINLNYNDVNQDICEFTNIVTPSAVIVNPPERNTYVFEPIIPEEQVIIDAIITDDDLIYHDNQLYISAGDNVYIRFIDPPTP